MAVLYAIRTGGFTDSMSSLIYFLKESIINFRRNWTTSTGAVVTIFLSLLIIGVFMVAGLIVNNVTESVESEVSITVYLADGSSDADVQTLTNDIKAMNDVASVTYVSKDEALADFSDMMSSNPEIAQQLQTDNPLPASLQVQLDNAQQVESIASQIADNATFQSICDEPGDPMGSLKYGQQTVERLLQVTNLIRVLGVALVALLMFVALIFINNTIRLTILARRREIAIMRLVGASNWFIRAPFLLEGAFQALIGAGLADIAIALMRHYALPMVTESISFLSIQIDSSSYVQIYAILIVTGIVIGLFGSGLAMRRYLKV